MTPDRVQRARMSARKANQVTQVFGNQYNQAGADKQTIPEKVQWPVWVGDLPYPASSFQRRTAVEQEIVGPHDGESDEILCRVLVGDGGVGKTQLAASIARNQRDNVDAQSRRLELLVWTDASDPELIAASYAQAARKLCLPEANEPDHAAAEGFLRWLPTMEQRWLIVLDNITELQHMESWWPDGHHRNGTVLATTRHRHALVSGGNRRLVPVGLYDDEQAMAYLHRRLADAQRPRLFEQKSAVELVGALGYLPLALSHAAAYMIDRGCDTAAYLRLFRDTRYQLPDLLPVEADTDSYGQPVATALLLSLNSLEAREASEAAGISGLSRSLLRLIALMDPVGHPKDLWMTQRVILHLQPSSKGWQRLLIRRTPNVDGQAVENALARLHNYALINQDTAQSPIRLHALTRRAILDGIDAEQLPVLARVAADAILDIWPHPEEENGELVTLLRTNAAFLLKETHPHLLTEPQHGCVRKVGRE
ncbi:NB-ARC domain-containing protein [Streptomyces phaeochromogenes]|uniref:NB-ARC domain-containing protein n=1 Tax=Streptomyces phaeochromogenes TaxID=1923 RepID=UPI0036C7B474